MSPDYRLALDARHPKPLPEQVEEEVLRLIRMGAPGFCINDVFKVQELARANSISRNTVTPAVKKLEQMGILEFTHKSGYRVLRSDPTIHIPVREELPLSMGEWAQLNGCTLSDVYPFPARELDAESLPHGDIRRIVREWLLLPNDKRIVLLRRIRFLIRKTDPSKRVPMYEEAYVRADALPGLCRDFNDARERNATDFSLFGYYCAHLKTKIRASHYFILADQLPEEVCPVWEREVSSLSPCRSALFTRLDTVNFCGPTPVPPLEKGGCLQYGREYYPSPYFCFQSENRNVLLTFG